MSKEKIVILGGGFASLTAAYALTTPKDWQDKYEVTLYQQGWRLGGKARTGRSLDYPQRIEETGLHIWFGGYHNSFNLLNDVYKELNRPSASPIRTIADAFLPQDTFNFEEYINGKWLDWCIRFPRNNQFLAGSLSEDENPVENKTLWSYLEQTLKWMIDQLKDLSFLRGGKHFASRVAPLVKPAWWKDLLKQVEHKVKDNLFSVARFTASNFLQLALWLVQTLDSDPQKHAPEHHGWLTWLLEKFRDWLYRRVKNSLDSTSARRLWIVCDLALTTIIGFLVDGVLTHGFNSIDQYDLQEWYQRHKGSEIMINSSIVVGLYMTLFAYENGHAGDPRIGDPGKPNLAAGAALIAFIWSLFKYRGSFVYRMTAGTGDSIIAPIYELLARRGVKFKFFHRVSEITSQTGTQVDEIKIARQADLAVEDYQPLFLVRDLPSWPSRPLYEQLVQGEELKAKGIDLESHWYTHDWQDVGEITLKAGEDFDRVILGIAIGALPYIAQSLIQQNEKWQQMIERIPTVQTQNLQLWFKDEVASQCVNRQNPLIVSYANPLSSWIHYPNLLYWEDRPSNEPNKSVYHASAVFPDPEGNSPPDDPKYPIEANLQIRQNAIEFLTHHSKQLFPQLSSDSGELNWDALVDPDNRMGCERINGQYWSGNINPTDRYVRAAAKYNSSARLVPYESGYANLYVVGTWTYNWAWNLGGMEIAAMSGLQVGRAIGGYPQHITGEHIR